MPSCRFGHAGSRGNGELPAQLAAPTAAMPVDALYELGLRNALQLFVAP